MSLCRRVRLVADDAVQQLARREKMRRCEPGSRRRRQVARARCAALRRRRTACIQRPVSHGQNCRASLESRARFQQRLQGARRPKLRREMSTGPSKFWRLAPTRQRCLLREMHHAQRTRKIVPSSKCAILVSVQPCLSKTCIETALSLEKYTKQWTLPSSMALATACSWSN